MRKVFNSEFPGQDADAWGKSWGDFIIERSVFFSQENNYLGYIFDRYFKQKLKVLEGGCGLAQHVICNRRRGVDIIGVDFSQEIIRKVKSQYPHIPLVVGRVENLPFKDSCFDVYYSGGVVEHFEEGPYKPLKEACRVLKKTGVLIITIPFINLMRRITDSFLCLKSGKRGIINQAMNKGYILMDEFSVESKRQNFHLYAFSLKEFKDILTTCGFRVLFSHGCSVAWGIKEIKWINYLWNRFKGNRIESKPESAGKRQSINNISSNPLLRFIKGILISERRDKIFFRPVVALLQGIFGNLAVFVCVNEKY